MRVLFFLIPIFYWTNAQVPPCPNGSIQFDPPKDINNGIYYPSNSSASPHSVFPDNFICNYKINVPQGMFATVQLYLSIGNPGNGTFPVIVTDQLQKSEGLYSADNEYFYFLANGASISLTTGMTNANFGFSINWSKFPTTFTPNLINIYKSGTQPQTVDLFQSRPCLVTAETRASVVIMESDYTFLLRSIMIYDGPDWNSTCLGTGYQLWKNNTQWVSTGKQMTVQLLTSFWRVDVRLIFQDYDNTKQIVQYQGVSLSSDQHTIVDLNSSQGPSALVTYGDDNNLFDIVTSLDGNGTLDVYIGGITSSKTNLIASYQVGNSTMFLPQTFRGKTRTYVLNGVNSKATINLDCKNYYSYSRPTDDQPIEKQGFISSSHYMESYTGQYVQEDISAPKGKLVTFSLVIRCADITQNTNFKVMVYNKYTLVYSEHYNVTNLPVLNQPITVIGDSLNVLFDSQKEPSKGLYMDFELSKRSSNFGVFVSILMSLFSIYFV